MSRFAAFSHARIGPVGGPGVGARRRDAAAARRFRFTGDTLNNKLDLLGIDLATLDTIPHSHGHYDHFGGVVGFIVAHGKKRKPGLPFYLGGEKCLCSRDTCAADPPSNFGALDRKAIAEAGLRVLFSSTGTRSTSAGVRVASL